MSFLAPWFLLGGAAVALPVVFHLIRRRVRERVPFSSVMFLKPSPPRLTRRNRLEHILLLVLRGLVLCLLAMAFARPFWREDAPEPAPVALERTWVVLVDTSASMRREGIWNLAARKVVEVAGRAAAGDALALVSFDREIKVLVGLEVWSRSAPGERVGLVQSAIEAVSPTWASTHLDKALMAAAELLQEGRTAARDTPGVVTVISDFQDGAILDGLANYAWPKGITVVAERMAPPVAGNAGLSWLSAEKDRWVVKAEERQRFLVANAPDSTRDQFRLQWDGVSGTNASVEVYVPAGQTRTAELPLPSEAGLALRARLTGDTDPFDNQVHVIAHRSEPVRFVAVGTGRTHDPASWLYFLHRAFPASAESRVRVEVNDVAGTVPAEGALPRLLVLGDRAGDAWLELARKVMAEGGTVLQILESAAGGSVLGRLLGRDEVGVMEAAVNQYAMLGHIDFTHPIFAVFREAKYGDFTPIHFWKYRQVNAASLPGARVVAKFDGGDPAVMEVPVGQGRLLILASGWQPSDSQLALSTKFVPLISAILDQAGALPVDVRQYVVGDVVDLAGWAQSRSGDEPLQWRGPDGADHPIPSGVKILEGTHTPGVYVAWQGMATNQFAVNLDPAESRTAPLALDRLEQMGVPLRDGAGEAATSSVLVQSRLTRDVEARQKLWRWWLAAAVGVLLMETILAGLLGRRSGQPTLEAT